jgi:Cu+-exporting ATPase
MANRRPFSPLTFFDTPPLFFAFVALGRLLEYFAKRKTSDALVKLIELQPNEAVRVKLGADNSILSEEVCNINLISCNDVVKVIPGAKFPVDGVVVNGDSMVDESMITGEPIPVSKKIGDPVTAGTINGNGILLVKATSVGGDTMLSQIVRLVEEAQNSKPRVQQIADKVAGVFVPIILLLSMVTFAVWSIVGHYHPHLAHLVESNCTLKENGTITYTTLNAFGDSAEFLDVAFFTAVAVLSIACPCSLALATPTAIMVGTGVGAQNGILIKGGEPLECMHKISTVIFDKTGTLTTGKPHVTVTRIYVSPSVCTPELALATAATAEKDSGHPLASAIVEYGKMVVGDDCLGKVSDFKVVPGKGVQCKVSALEKVSAGKQESQEAPSNMSVLIGSRMLMKDNHIAIPAEVEDNLQEMERSAQTAVILAIDGVLIATLAIADTLKEDSAAAVRVLTRMGLKTVLLTGDNEGTAWAIANQVESFTDVCIVMPILTC